MGIRPGMLIVTAVVMTLSLGCTKQSETEAPVAQIEDRVFAVTPNSVNAKTGIVTGEVTEMKVTESVEQGSGKVVSPAKLTGTLKLKNHSADQSVRLVAARIQYVDTKGQPIKLEEARTEPTIAFGSYGSDDQLDPGEEVTRSLDVAFPANALKANELKEMRLQLSYIPSPFKEEVLSFPVSIDGE